MNWNWDWNWVLDYALAVIGIAATCWWIPSRIIKKLRWSMRQRDDMITEAWCAHGEADRNYKLLLMLIDGAGFKITEDDQGNKKMIRK